MYSLMDIEKRLDKVEKKIKAIENNADIYKLSRKVTETQQRYLNKRKDQEEQRQYLKALADVHACNVKELKKINEIANTARAELIALNQALEALNNISITFTGQRIYAMQMALTKLWPLNQRDDKGKCLCPVTGKVIEEPIYISNGCQYSKAGLERIVEDEKYFPRYLPGSSFPLSKLDKTEISDKLAIAPLVARRAASVFLTTSAIVGGLTAGLGVIFLIASFFFPPLFPAAITLFMFSLGVTVGVGPLLGLAAAGIGYVLGKIIDHTSLPSEFAPEAKRNSLKSSAKLHQVMDIKSGNKKEFAKEVALESVAQYEPVSAVVNFEPQYTASNKLG